MSEQELKPFAWAITKIGCIAPDDCEEYLDLVLDSEVDQDELAKYLKHGLAVPLFPRTPSPGMVEVPVEPTPAMSTAGAKAISLNGGEGNLDELGSDADAAYVAMINAAQQTSGDEGDGKDRKNTASIGGLYVLGGV